MLRLFSLWSLLSSKIHTRIASERGATAVEYGLMIAVIAAIVVLTVVTLGTQIHEAFCEVSTNFETLDYTSAAADCPA